LFANSKLILGIIEEIDIFKIKASTDLFYGAERWDTEELTSSIKVNGLLQPIIVRTHGNYFEIVAGSRRYNACKSLRWRKILCHIVELDDKEAMEVSLAENIQRKSLDPIEEARGFKFYVDKFGWGGITDLSWKISKSPSYICKRMSLLDLPKDALEAIQNGLINKSAAEELLSIRDESQRTGVANLLVKKNMSCRMVRKLVQESKEIHPLFETKEPDIQGLYYEDKISTIDAQAQRAFDKSITALKIAINRIVSVIEGVEDNWIIYETLMQHKNMLNAQIDILLKQKKKL
jgi:ParB family transcriptional regulator, chromosome partitioning protein